MKTIKILLGIIALNLTLLTLLESGVWPPKLNAQNVNSNQNNGSIPLNADGSINVKLVNEVDLNYKTINSIKPPAIMDINIERIRGFKAGYTRNASNGWVGLDVVPCTYRGTVVYDGDDEMPEWWYVE